MSSTKTFAIEFTHREDGNDLRAPQPVGHQIAGVVNRKASGRWWRLAGGLVDAHVDVLAQVVHIVAMRPAAAQVAHERLLHEDLADEPVVERGVHDSLSGKQPHRIGHAAATIARCTRSCPRRPGRTDSPVLPGHHAAAPAEIQALTLDNGLRIIVWPDRDIPNVALYNFVRVGSRNEAPGITGLAHFFEHMMFNGTGRRPPGEFDREMEAHGGSNNATTSDDLTTYMDWFPKDALELVFDLEGDRLGHLAFDPKVVESERGVVYSERRLRVDDDNTGFLAEQVQSTAFAAHPYHIPTIGWPSDIEGWTLADPGNPSR